jgi:hypothetical protein
MLKSKKAPFILLISCLVNLHAFTQVQLRDSVLSWQQHSFQLNEDYSMNWFNTASNSRQMVHFQAKVIENELIRLVILPEYGGRVISFLYKPTNHEYLYHSECGSPYGMNESNFYYDWLMVYGGIFPTFPEPEHGKTWLVPWEHTILKQTGDTVILSLEYTDDKSFARAPGKFNNGITGITCRVNIGVHRGSSMWDFDVTLENNRNDKVKYEYWTCTTLSPGSPMDDTGCPLNTEMVVPITRYKADWSPGSWIGNYGGLYDFDRINYLDKWTDMGIAYAWDLRDNYWGVINHTNQEGIFRISENIMTPGLKFWTWGKQNIDNNLFDFNNGGKDNYIELWAGNSEAFFKDAILEPYETIQWKESYGPTIGLSSIAKINHELALNLDFDPSDNRVNMEIFSFSPGQEYLLNVSLNGEADQSLASRVIQTSSLGNFENISLGSAPSGQYELRAEVFNNQDELLILASKDITIIQTGIDAAQKVNSLVIKTLGDNRVQITLQDTDHYDADLYNLKGQLINHQRVSGNIINLSAPSAGMYFLKVTSEKSSQTQKIFIR